MYPSYPKFQVRVTEVKRINQMFHPDNWQSLAVNTDIPSVGELAYRGMRCASFEVKVYGQTEWSRTVKVDNQNIEQNSYRAIWSIGKMMLHIQSPELTEAAQTSVSIVWTSRFL